MANISVADSTYTTGGLDSRATLDGTSDATFQQMNGAASGVIAVETILGDGPTLKGTVADLATRLAVEHNADGTQKTLPVAKGGTGVTNLADGGVLVGNGSGGVQVASPPSTEKALVHTGVVGSDPFWAAGLLYQGPPSIEASSTRTFEGATVISGNQNLSGIHFYSTFVLNSGVTLTLPAGSRRLIIMATQSITISGTIAAQGAGGPGGIGATGVATGAAGSPGTDQPGGGGAGDTGGTGTFAGQSGGAVLNHGCTVQAGGVGAGQGAGGAATQVSGSSIVLPFPYGFMGGGGGGGAGDGGGGSGGSGGNGGGSIVLIAPVVTLSAGCILNTSGNGGGGASVCGGGGGGAGNLYIFCRSYTNNGATHTANGGAAGGGAAPGGAGAAGVRQILIYG